MAIEIEHKYKVKNESYKEIATSATYYKQGYICSDKNCIVRVRIAGEKAMLTIKGETHGASRSEYEVEIDIATAQSLLNEFCPSPIVEKTRYVVPYGHHTWEVDCYHGKNNGLIVAEIELQSEHQLYELPPFIGENVTGIPRYYNSCLAQHPYSEWDEADK